MSVVFTLTGRIQAEQVPELQALLGSGSSDLGVVLDMSNVRLVDRDAVRFLAKSENAGTVLRNCSAYIREWITQEKNVMHKTETENATGLAG
jgi:anti-anti-sigma regulatory factor